MSHPYYLDEEQLYLYQPYFYQTYFTGLPENIYTIALDEFSGQLYYPIGYPGQAPGDFAFDSTGIRWEWDGQQWNNF